MSRAPTITNVDEEIRNLRGLEVEFQRVEKIMKYLINPSSTSQRSSAGLYFSEHRVPVNHDTFQRLLTLQREILLRKLCSCRGQLNQWCIQLDHE